MPGSVLNHTPASRLRLLVLFLVSTLLCLGAYWLVLTLWQPVPVHTLAQPSSNGTSSINDDDHSALLAGRREAVPSEQALQLNTFRGASPDGRLRVDARGQLIVDRQLRHWLDGWLSVQGEWSLEQVTAEMIRQINQLPQPGRDQALSLMSQWMDYRRALADYDERSARSLSQMTLTDLQQRLDWVERLRRQYFEADVVRAFFADDEALDRYLLARRQQQLGQASDEQVQQALAQMPEALQHARQQSQLLLNNPLLSADAYREQTADSSGATQGQVVQGQVDQERVYQERARQYGEAAAQRLAQLDSRQQQWQQRLQAYQQFEQSLASEQTAEARERQLQSYRQTNFSAAEQRRLTAALQLLTLSNSGD